MRIGLRTIKTGLAVTLGVIISNYFQNGSAFYVIVAAIIAMQPTVSDSWKTGVNRILGTFVGAIIGAAFAYTVPVNPVTTGLGIIVLIYILNKLKWRESVSIGSVVFIGIFLNGGANHFEYALGRLIDTSTGIGVAVAVNYLFFPPTYDNKIINEVNGASKFIWSYIYNIFEIYLEPKQSGKTKLFDEIEEIDSILADARKFLNLQIKEEKVLIYGNYKCNDLVNFIQGTEEIYQNVLNIDRIFQNGIKTEVTNLIYDEFMDMKDIIKLLKDKETLMVEERKINENLNKLLQKVKDAKLNLKFNEKINEYPTDDVVKILVLLYNLEEILKKFKMIKGY